MSHHIPIRLPLSRRFRNPCFLSQMRSRVSTCDSRSGYHSFLSQTRSRFSTYSSRSGLHSSVRHFHGTKKSEPNQASGAYIFRPNGKFPIKPAGRKAFRVIKGKAEK
ncbi:putative galactose mutarotase-like domain superfamily [Helianthus annuus]|uniref:Galactose mutarotase-like domain superfamily n=1 Tax=Helianthus annuus TaxID=4232 RepID=A0A251UR14_HELAN|nr:putative galactose mutarotase-like domain superfamily [Helianthus annuus]KAJ0476473.1 putative galactose mutarotase-like domain superfamily [Helianthus annuus]KAJ0497300.1 putative galactose mutarotase-like domain superfamily [Helianthus annuus]KAJ0663309.1 putative galactose mutarotase-like domain superfamily [Helianthus annuus]KAJ0670816.1 putative galactose mutarotase-like domain superfamily [Helianthus annuus]